MDLIAFLRKLISKIYYSKNNRQSGNKKCGYKRILLVNILVVLYLSMTYEAFSQRHMEYLTRGLVAAKTSDYVFLGWRMFATDHDSVQFNLYRNDTLVNKSPVSGLSNYIDSSGTVNSIYYLVTIYDSVNTEISTPVTVWQEEYKTILLHTPEAYSPNDASVADLDGDGELEIIVKMEGISHDNAHEGVTDPVILHAYKLNGTLLWSINLGVNIRAGAHYTQLMVYDLNGDGIADVACKTAPGTKDGTGEYLNKGPAASDDDDTSYVNSDGRILAGPEYLTVFSGTTGEELSTVYYLPRRHPDTENPTSSQLNDIWGDGYGNRVDRFLACVAYFDSIPSLVMCRGYYTRTVLAAWDFDGDSLTQRWIFDTDDGYPEYEGQGAHSLSVGDADNDGKDEIMYGAMAIDDDGSPLYNTGFCHGDATHLGDFIPSNPGLEFYMPSESAGSVHNSVPNPGVHVRNAGTGEVIWSIPASGDIGRAMTADITADYPGNEFWAAGGLGVYNSNGNVFSSSNFPPINFAAWWDGDLLREMLDGITVSKWNELEDSTILSANGCLANNGSKSTPVISGDILGDWREEVIFRTSNNQALRIYTTTIPTQYSIYTLLQDPQYRLALTWQNVAYNQPPHPSFFIGDGMNIDSLPVPDINVHQPGDAIINITSPVNDFELGLGLDLDVIVHAIGISDTNQMVIISDGITPLDTILSPPYYIRIPGLTTGEYSLIASGYVKSGQLIQSQPIDITVDEGYPHVTLTSPPEGYTYLPEDSITITAVAYDTDGSIDSVTFYMDNNRLTALNTYPYSIEIENPGIGVHELKAIAYDNDSNSTESKVIYIEVGVSTTIQEAETGFCGFNNGTGWIESNHAGYTGTGFANTDNHSGIQIYWAVDFPESATYKFEWRYAATNERPGKLLLNDTLASNVPFISTGDWSVWDTVSVTANAHAGIMKVTLEAVSNDGLANIDYLKIVSLETSEEVTAISCDSLPVYNREEIIIFSQNGLILFPVPAQNYINILLRDRTEIINDISIYSIDGRKILSTGKIYSNQSRIELPEMQNGIYFIHVSTNNNSYSRKFNVHNK